MPLRISLRLNNPALLDKHEVQSQIFRWIAKILYIFFSLAFGIALLSLPWFNFWENNHVLYALPQLRPMISSPYVKGAIFGLGIVNIMIGIQEIANLCKRNKFNKNS
jgi:hypothetical protein